MDDPIEIKSEVELIIVDSEVDLRDPLANDDCDYLDVEEDDTITNKLQLHDDVFDAGIFRTEAMPIVPRLCIADGDDIVEDERDGYEIDDHTDLITANDVEGSADERIETTVREPQRCKCSSVS